MGENIIILCGDGSIQDYVSELATRSGEDLGLVLTAIAFEDEKVSGGRIEEDRRYGKETFQTFDEPIFIGSAIAQLAGHADAVVVDSLDDWAQRLLMRFPDDPVELDAEISSLTSVMKAGMSDLLLLIKKPEFVTGSAEHREMAARILTSARELAGTVIDATIEPPSVLQGELPG